MTASVRDRDSIRAELIQLSLPAIVLLLFDGTASRSELAYRCESPHKSLTRGSALPRPLIPLWECGTIVTAFDSLDRSFCKLSLEAPREYWFSGVSFDGVIADLMIDLWEDELSETALSEMADLMEFARWQQLASELERGPNGDYHAWRTALRENRPFSAP
ncbi:hypothetical protein [Brevifollis gellanilyticus]|uniref:Uncharacterized protein n=1 Tax=Brevifollis gellanilyticus TaxID=748831 RepID=A0A512MDA0_9BACT|nr:hypothetical protein [Brevifollis gellanilyticus]GEP44709.1 hypothetical protein BGE01nite_40000 [Brevifollis gellanilyticus]